MGIWLASSEQHSRSSCKFRKVYLVNLLLEWVKNSPWVTCFLEDLCRPYRVLLYCRMLPWGSWSLIFPSYISLRSFHVFHVISLACALGLTVESLFSLEHSTMPFWQGSPRLVLFWFPFLETSLFFFFFELFVFLILSMFPFCFYKFFPLLLYICLVFLFYRNNCLQRFFSPHSEILGYNLRLICGYIFWWEVGFILFFLPAVT